MCQIFHLSLLAKDNKKTIGIIRPYKLFIVLYVHIYFVTIFQYYPTKKTHNFEQKNCLIRYEVED